ncbi:hypothetical protein SU60_15975 [Vibrio mytili]|uniref:Uncharacterized protein n=1 Tax=Vibrio mytili TaxID=50718 RepID=A0A0C3E6G6_9VIBR|nr:hypothetical protein SU60_15975 [Vibrio mytili]
MLSNKHQALNMRLPIKQFSFLGENSGKTTVSILKGTVIQGNMRLRNTIYPKHSATFNSQISNKTKRLNAKHRAVRLQVLTVQIRTILRTF